MWKKVNVITNANMNNSFQKNAEAELCSVLRAFARKYLTKETLTGEKLFLYPKKFGKGIFIFEDVNSLYIGENFTAIDISVNLEDFIFELAIHCEVNNEENLPRFIYPEHYRFVPMESGLNATWNGSTWVIGPEGEGHIRSLTFSAKPAHWRGENIAHYTWNIEYAEDSPYRIYKVETDWVIYADNPNQILQFASNIIAGKEDSW